MITRDLGLLLPVRRGLGAAWFADRRRTFNGLALSALGDNVGHAELAQGTAASQPTIVRDERQAIRFDGSNDQLSRAVASSLQPSARGLSVAFVGQGRSGSTGDYPPVVSCRPWAGLKDAGYALSVNGSGTSGYMTAHYADGATGFDHNDSGASAGVGLSTTKRELWVVVFDDVNDRIRWYRDGLLIATTAPTFPSSAPVSISDFRIGADRAVGVGTRFLSMDLHAMAQHSEPLAAQEVAAYAAAWMPLFGVRR